MNSVVLACGNVLRSDDGIAVYVAHRLFREVHDTDIRIICCHQWLPEQAEELVGAELAVFIDASANLEAGKIEVLPILPSSNDVDGMSHCLDPGALLGMARSLYGHAPERAVLVSIGGSSFIHGYEFSDRVNAAIPEILRQVKTLLCDEPVVVG